MEINKRDAAVHQIKTAIDCFFAQDPVCAITLAGAAEESLPEPPKESDKKYYLGIIKGMRKEYYMKEYDLDEKDIPSEKDLIREINLIRDWLKHDKSEIQKMEIENINAWIMIIRAITKFNAVYESAGNARMEEFADWSKKALPEIVKEYG